MGECISGIHLRTFLAWHLLYFIALITVVGVSENYLQVQLEAAAAHVLLLLLLLLLTTGT
jgi:hypothetical protein